MPLEFGHAEEVLSPRFLRVSILLGGEAGMQNGLKLTEFFPLL